MPQEIGQSRLEQSQTHPFCRLIYLFLAANVTPTSVKCSMVIMILKGEVRKIYKIHRLPKQE